MRRGHHNSTVAYTGIEKVTLAVTVDVAGEENDPALLGTRKNADSHWSGVAGYVAYDWTKALRTALRLEHFSDPDGVRSSETIAPGLNTELWEVTATAESTIWRGLIGRLEYRHDQANRDAFSIRDGRGPTSREHDTITLALSYIFF